MGVAENGEQVPVVDERAPTSLRCDYEGLTNGVPVEVIRNRTDMSLDVLAKHYDTPTVEERIKIPRRVMQGGEENI